MEKWAVGKQLRHLASSGPEKAQCTRSLVWRCVFKIKGFIITTVAETTAVGNNFLESRGSMTVGI